MNRPYPVYIPAVVVASTPELKRYIQPGLRAARRSRANAFWLSLSVGLTLLAVAPLFWIVGYVFMKGLPALNLAFFTRLPAGLASGGGGVLHAIEGTLVLGLLASLFATPVGVLAAFYTTSHPNAPLGVAVRFGTDVLGGVPSIVVGLFGYALVVRPQGHYSALAGSIALAIIMLPTLIRTTEEMLKLVPQNLREGSLALGAPEWKTALKVTLPAALSGILTGFLLALARASGETAPLLFTALGNDHFEIGRQVSLGLRAGQPIWTVLGGLLSQPVDSLPLTLYKYTQQPFPERLSQAWGVALLLLVFILLVNTGARLWVQSKTARNQG